jgi:hypothetical protein
MHKCKDGGVCGLGGFCLGCPVEEKCCFSCDKEFIVEIHNDRDEGYFCDDCLGHKPLAKN